LADLYSGTYKRLLVNMPPRSGKTLAATLFTAYVIKNSLNPAIGYVTYEADLAQDHIKKAATYAGVKMQTTSTAPYNKTHQLSNNGHITGLGIGAGLTGLGLDLGIIDDPLKNSVEASNPTILNNQYTWLNTSFLTRFHPKSRLALFMSRWNKNDLSGHIKRSNKGSWKIVVMPQVNTGIDRWDWLGRKFGEPLGFVEKRDEQNPNLYSTTEFSLKLAGMLEQKWWEARYQQNPTDDNEA
jgi:hypothetical protein